MPGGPTINTILNTLRNNYGEADFSSYPKTRVEKLIETLREKGNKIEGQYPTYWTSSNCENDPVCLTGNCEGCRFNASSEYFSH